MGWSATTPERERLPSLTSKQHAYAHAQLYAQFDMYDIVHACHAVVYNGIVLFAGSGSVAT